jgi:hypothetical protein
MIAIVVTLVVFVAFIGLLLGGAYMEMGKELPCKRASMKQASSIRTPETAAKESQDENSFPTAKAA